MPFPQYRVFYLLVFLLLILLLLPRVSVSQVSDPAGGFCSIDGTVVLEAEKLPARRVVVAAKSLPDGPSITVLTDDAGSFHFRDLPSGKYDVFSEEAGGYASLHVTAQLADGSQTLNLTLKSRAMPEHLVSGNSVSIHDLRITPKARASFAEGLRLFAKREAEESLTHFRKAVDLWPEFYEAYYSIGLVDIYLLRYSDAIEAFQKSIDLSSGQYLLPQFAMGVALWQVGRLPESEKVLRSALEADPSFANGHVYLSVVLYGQNRLEEAEKSAQAAVLRDPKLATPYLILAAINARWGNLKEQLRYLEHYLALDADEKGTIRALYDSAKARQTSAGSPSL